MGSRLHNKYVLLGALLALILMFALFGYLCNAAVRIIHAVDDLGLTLRYRFSLRLYITDTGSGRFSPIILSQCNAFPR